MDIQALKEKIESLDPKAHKALRDVLTSEYNRLAGGKGKSKPQGETASDPFAEMFEKAADELNRRYIEGTLDYIRKNHPNLCQKTNEAEDRLNEVWKAGLQAKAGIEEFREVLNQWYVLNLRGIKTYSKEQGKQLQ
ncbi:MAG TPA: hypothetical protein VM123_17425 [archaeon]|nr:hypothetical protein [archaeon]